MAFASSRAPNCGDDWRRRNPSMPIQHCSGSRPAASLKQPWTGVDAPLNDECDRGRRMIASQYDVVVVGAGAAGVTAAIGLARTGFRVAAVEAATYPGAENWSGCVYFCENLAHPDILG